MKPIQGSLASIIRNDEGLYEGDLAHYFRAVFNNARNLNHPYHNFRHIFHVLWLCHCACHHYKKNLTKREIRNLLIADMFHDFDHSGRMGNDDLNIMLALRGLKKHLAPEDVGHYDDIARLIMLTQYPYDPALNDQVDLRGNIIRDADLSQALSVAWIQQVIFGLSAEWNMKPIEVFRQQIPFLRNLRFHTEWAQETFDLEEKLVEVNSLLDLLEFGTSPDLGVKK
ncbi:MAG: hypothetical protein PHG25_02340 [Candidatus Pacebacteria bacterium]|nr:hypothetical protein [Candidatus Paceibacterota bacterium]